MGAVVFLAGCGGNHPTERVVSGTGYTFRAPGGWEVARSAREVRAADNVGSGALVGVSRFPLLHVFRPALWTKVVRELDGASAAIARRQHGAVLDSADATISGRRARRYRVAYAVRNRKLVEELAFVLRGKTEYVLLCRYERGAAHEACDTLLSSFRLS